MLASLVIVLGSMSLHSEAAAPKLNKKSVTIKVGKSVQLKVKGTKKKVKWSSSKKKVCTVSSKGLVKAKKKGTATVKAKVGKKTLKCKVTVKAAPGGSTNPSAPRPVPSVKATGLKISGASSVLAPGGTMQLSVSFLPANARAEAVTWGVSDSYYASVSNGLVKAGTREGTVKIYAWLDANKDGWRDSDEIYASYDITIKNISATAGVGSVDGGDLLLTDSNARAVLTFAMSDTVPDVKVNVVDSIGTAVRSYSMGTLGADVDTTCIWDLKDSSGAKASAGSYRFEIQAVGATLYTDYFTIYAKSDFGSGNGSPTSPYQVSTLEQLKLVGSHNGACFVQTANIDLNLTALIPLFTTDVPFTGTYDGGGHSITNVSNMMSSNDIGIFSAVGENGTIQNLTVEGSFFNGASQVAALVGKNSGTISNCTVKNCSVTASGTNGAALVGYNEGTIKNCVVSGNTVVVQARSGNVGSVCGYNGGTVTGCVSSSDTITASGSDYWRYAGGIVGYNTGNLISCQISSGVISANRWEYGFAGGIAGYNSGSVANCSVSSCEISSCMTPGGIIGSNAGNNTNNTYTGSLNQIGG